MTSGRGVGRRGERSSHIFEFLTADGQTQACACGLGRIERLEGSPGLDRFHSRSIILHHDLNSVAVEIQQNIHLVGAGFSGISEQVEHRSSQQHAPKSGGQLLTN